MREYFANILLPLLLETGCHVCMASVKPSVKPHGGFPAVRTHLKKTISCAVHHVKKEKCGHFLDLIPGQAFIPLLLKDNLLCVDEPIQ